MRDAGIDALLISNPTNRRYLTGFTHKDGDMTESAGWALVTPNRLALINGTFHMSGLEHEIVASGAQWLTTDEKQPWEVLAAAVSEDNVGKLGFEKAWLSYERFERLQQALGGGSAQLVPTDDLVKHARASKDEAELDILRRAAKMGDEAFRRLIAQIHVGMTERQIAKLLDSIMLELGGEESAFSTIVAAGPGGALPHWTPTDRDARVGEPILIDFGVRVNGYCSDCTRTFCFGAPDPQLVAIYAVVRRAQDAVVAALESGVRRGRDIDAAARKVVQESAFKDRFIHSLGHGVGLAIHELPNARALKENTPQAEAELAAVEQIGDNMILTNEPGIYIPGWGGVRLEDMLLITPGGVEILTERNPEQILSLPVK
jgi:Xaa-Pro aminopeptidase